MGIVHSIKEYCFEEGTELKKSAFHEASEIINEDYLYFQEEKWYRLQNKMNFDPDKFIFLYPQYKNEQSRLQTLWNIVNLKRAWNSGQIYSEDKIMSERWKYAIRKGVPIAFYKSMIQTMFNKRISPHNLEESYKELHMELIRSPGLKNKPIQQTTPNAPFLNTGGFETLKRMSFLIQSHYGKLRSNPFLKDVIALLLIFLEEEMAYLIISFMLETSSTMSEERQASLHWYFTFSQQQFEKFANQFYNMISKISPTIFVINNHLNKEGINKVEVFKEIVGNFFYGYLPFSVIVKLFLVYLNEGVKIFYRIFYAILKLTGPAIRDATNTKSIFRVIRNKMLNDLTNDKAIRKFFRLAYDLRIGKIESLEKIQISSKKKYCEGISYYLPIIENSSQILSFQDLQTIWEFLPKRLKHYDLKKVFPKPDTTIFSLKKMKDIIEEQNFVLIIIETSTNYIFGVFIFQKLKSSEGKPQVKKNFSTFSNSKSNEDEEIKTQKKRKEKTIFNYGGSSESFVFTIFPDKKKYSSTGENAFFCLMSEDSLAIGGPAKSPALQLNEELLSGLSFCCPTYQNQPLHNGPPGLFGIHKIECFFLQ